MFAAFSVTSRAQRAPSGGQFFPNVASPSPGTTFSLAPAAAAACQRTVFAGLAVDCNLNDGGSYDACCDRLARRLARASRESAELASCKTLASTDFTAACNA